MPDSQQLNHPANSASSLSNHVCWFRYSQCKSVDCRPSRHAIWVWLLRGQYLLFTNSDVPCMITACHEKFSVKFPEGTSIFYPPIDIQDYPANPPKVTALTTNSGRCRFAPNIYANGKVCLCVCPIIFTYIILTVGAGLSSGVYLQFRTSTNTNPP